MSLKTAICVIIKNENDYLDEWINYHLNLGINEIFLYEDYGSKSHLDIVMSYGDRVHLNSIDVIYNCPNILDAIKQYSFIQRRLFEYFVKMYRSNFDWILFNDIDEFLILKKPLHELLEMYSNESALYLRWKMYGASGHVTKPIGNVMDNYTDFVVTNLDYNWQYKSFINCKKFKQWETHHRAKDGIFPKNMFGDHMAWINHYFTKSWEEWKNRIIDRGDLVPGNRKIMQFFELNSDMIPMSKDLLLEVAINEFGLNKDNFSRKNDLLLEIAINKATKLGFNKNKDKGTKYLHFCWFGGKSNNINDSCINSWKKYLSDDFIVCLWDEYIFDCLEIPFVKDAYENKKWTFINDYVSLWVMYNFGGIYLSTDVELLKPIDNLPTNFLSIERGSNKINLGNGFGVKKGNEVISDMLNIYNRKIKLIWDKRFIIKSPTITTTYFLNKGFDTNNKEINEFLGFTIYPDKYFCPKDYITKEINITEETISIHHY